MKFYKLRLRLSGLVGNEVLKSQVSAAEVLLLNEVHGGEAVASLEEQHSEQFTQAKHKKLRADLEKRYPRQKQRDIMNSLFGTARSATLPETVSMEDVTASRPEDDEEEDEVEESSTGQNDEPPGDQNGDQEQTDPKEAVKASLRELNWPIPRGNVSIEKLREELTAAQKAHAEKNADQSVL